MSSLRTRLTTVLTVGAGAAAGALVSLALQHPAAEGPTPVVEATVDLAVRPRVVTVASADGGQEPALIQLAEAMLAPSDSVARPAEPEPVVDPVDEPGELRRLEEEFGAKLESHDREPRDVRWARDAETHFSDDFEGLAASTGFELGRVDCRSTTCTVETVWNSYDHARQSAADAVHMVTQEQCSREVMLPVPEDTTAPYSATIIYTCTQER